MFTEYSHLMPLCHLTIGQQDEQKERRGGDRRAERGAREMRRLCLSPTLSAASGFHGDGVSERGRRARTPAPQEKQLLRSSRFDPRHPAPITVSRLAGSSRRLRSSRSPATGASARQSPVRATGGLQGVTGLHTANTPACLPGDARRRFVWQLHRRMPAMPCKLLPYNTLVVECL